RNGAEELCFIDDEDLAGERCAIHGAALRGRLDEELLDDFPRDALLLALADLIVAAEGGEFLGDDVQVRVATVADKLLNVAAFLGGEIAGEVRGGGWVEDRGRECDRRRELSHARWPM